jgi:hemerythrin-like domain-containing protein
MASQRSEQPEDAIALLMDDHRRVKELFEEFRKFQYFSKNDFDDLKQELMDAVCAELKIHTQIEEELFYPAAREALDDEDLMNEAEVEHAGVKDLIEQIEDGEAADPMTCARFMVLSEYIDHHIKEEHEEMFPKLRKTPLDTIDLGRKMKARKAQIQTRMGMIPYDEIPSPGAGAKPSLWERLASARTG